MKTAESSGRLEGGGANPSFRLQGVL